jgi:hypothetical protein
MTAAPAIQRRGGGPLGVWAVGPVIGLAAVLAALASLPEHGCNDGFSLTDSAAGIIFLAVAGIASALSIGAGVWRFESLYRHERAGEQAEAEGDVPPPPSRRSVVGTLLAALAILVALAAWGGSDALATEVFFAFILGGLATFVAFLFVAVASVRRRPPDEVDMALPVYLVGSGLFVYPALVDLAFSFSSGTWGC